MMELFWSLKFFLPNGFNYTLIISLHLHSLKVKHYKLINYGINYMPWNNNSVQVIGSTRVSFHYEFI
jgi:hypothetical protein